MKDLYSSHHFSPAGIYTSAAMYGVKGADPKTANVLEIGCGEGEDLIRFAVANPLSSSAGIDVDPDSVREGQQKVSAFGIENTHLYCLGLQDLFSIDPGKFDYIIIQQFFSLLDEETRYSLLSFCEQHLTEQGIIAVKWNTLPGAQVTDTLREAIALHTQNSVSDEEKISSARAMLGFMNIAHPDGALKDRITEALSLSDTELAVRYIYSKNDARYFVNFTHDIIKSNINYVGDVTPQYEIAQHYGKEVATVHTTATERLDKITAQQYLDFAVDRQVRFSLLISKNNQSVIHEQMQFSEIENLHWAGNYQRQADAKTFYNRQGESLTSDNDLLGRILDVMGNSWPLSVSTQQIIKNTYLPEEPEQHAGNVIKTLQALYIENVSGIYASLTPSPYNLSRFGNLKLIYPTDNIIWPECGYIESENLWGEKAVLKKSEAGFVQSGLRLSDEESYMLAMDLVSKGLLTGSDIAWLRLYQQVMALQDVDIARRRISSLMLFSASTKEGGFRQEHAGHKSLSKKTENDVDQKALSKVKGLYLSGHVQESFEIMEELRTRYPNSVTLLSDISSIYHQANNVDEALRCLTKGLSINSGLFEFYSGIVLCLSKLNDRHYPKKVAQHLLRNHPKNAEAWDLLGKVYNDLRNSLKYEYCARKAADMNSNNATYLLKLGNVLSERNQMREAREYLEKGVRLSESSLGYFANYSNMLFVILHDHQCSPEEILAEHQKYGQKLSAWAKNKTVERPVLVNDNPRLRVGFVSGDFRDHPVSNFIYPVLSSIDKTRFDVIGYNVSPSNDRHTQLYAALSSEWNDVKSLSHIELAEKIAADGIDILIDLSGHTAFNRLPVFGLKPAPVQMSWIGYPGTTGVKEMDYYLIDSNFAAPGVLDSHFTEKLAYLPAAKQFEPADYNIDVNALPALKNGYITFATFNRPQKITAAVLDAWARILTQLPDARLLFASMSDEEMIEKYMLEFESRGVRREQIIARLKCGFGPYLQMHNDVDIILDTFPYTGGTTTNHASWMGVPSLTLAGDSVVSRQAGAAMKFLGLEEFVASSTDEYVAKAVALNGQFEHLNSVRLSLRDRILEREKRVSHRAFYFEKVLEQAWSLHQQGLPAQAIVLADD